MLMMKTACRGEGVCGGGGGGSTGGGHRRQQDFMIMLGEECTEN